MGPFHLLGLSAALVLRKLCSYSYTLTLIPTVAAQQVRGPLESEGFEIKASGLAEDQATFRTVHWYHRTIVLRIWGASFRVKTDEGRTNAERPVPS